MWIEVFANKQKQLDFYSLLVENGNPDLRVAEIAIKAVMNRAFGR
jgi:hypothetical protein